MINMAIGKDRWEVSVGKNKNHVHAEDCRFPAGDVLAETGVLITALGWVFKQFESEGYAHGDESLSISVSPLLKPYLTGGKIPKSGEGVALVSKCRVITGKFKSREII